jgi:hypothetical protein
VDPTHYYGELGKLPDAYEWERWNLPRNCRGTLHLGKQQIPLFCSPLIQNRDFLKNFLGLADSELRKLAESGIDIYRVFNICAAHAPRVEDSSLKEYAAKKKVLRRCARNLRNVAADIRQLEDPAFSITTARLNESLKRIGPLTNPPFARNLDDPITLIAEDGTETGPFYPVNADFIASPPHKIPKVHHRNREGTARALSVNMRLFRPEWPDQFAEAAARLEFLANHVLHNPKHRPREEEENSFIESVAALCTKYAGKPLDPQCCELFKVTFDIRASGNSRNGDDYSGYRIRRERLSKTNPNRPA